MWASYLPLILVCTLLSYSKKTYSYDNFIKLCIVVPFIQLHCFLDSNQTETKCYPLFRPVCVFFYTILSYENRNSFFCKNFILCDSLFKICVFFVKTVILFKWRFGIWTDMNDRPCIVLGKVNDRLRFLIPDLLQQNTHYFEVCSDWLNWCNGPSDWLVKIGMGIDDVII